MLSGQGSVTSAIGHRWVFIRSGTATVSCSARLTVVPSGKNWIGVTCMYLEDNDISRGNGRYIYGDSFGTASYVDQEGTRYTLRFTRENGRVTLRVTSVFNYTTFTKTETLTGTKVGIQ